MYIECLNSSYRRLNKVRNMYPSSDTLMKVLYLSTLTAKKKWSMRAKN
jgi:putative transposase